MELKISSPKNIASKNYCYIVSNGGKGKCSIELGLNLDLSYSKFSSTNGYGFTFLQRQELEQQFSIYKYIEAGLPVPSYLIIPICKSINCSLKSLHGGNYPHYTNLMGYGHLCWELKSSMEAEPRRCKRTDGKKWRCSKSVVQNQKYCEKHMHRGRQRSTKYVASDLQLSSNSTIKRNSTILRAAEQDNQINSQPDTASFSIALPIN
ncbi:hypothetical protein HAX54_020763 [Datura stramonium]|uniref:Growth-regulating factor n=1 Tax=Datura stramonium TaxID=4076 RepID=A0ABS8RK67_DATST|nr:hypothetical protein [Datura stramonium]